MTVGSAAPILLAGCLALVSACTTSRTLSETETPPLDFPAPTPSRIVKPGESFGLEIPSGQGANEDWQCAVKIEISVAEWGWEKKLMTEREFEIEKADLETFRQELPNLELRSKPTVITFPGQIAMIESGSQIPVPTDSGSETGSMEMILEGFAVSLLPAAPSGTGPRTPLSQIRERDISVHVLAAINEKEDFPRGEDQPVPSVHQYRIDRKLVLEPGVTTEAGRITREKTIHVTDKIPVLADIPLIGQLFRHEFPLEVRNTTVLTVRANWVERREIYYQDS